MSNLKKNTRTLRSNDKLHKKLASSEAQQTHKDNQVDVFEKVGRGKNSDFRRDTVDKDSKINKMKLMDDAVLNLNNLLFAGYRNNLDT